MNALPSPSVELDAVIQTMSPHCGAFEVTLKGKDFDDLVRRLALIRKLMLSMEREVGAFRLAEAGRHGRAMVDALASEQLHELVLDPEGKVVRPDFGRRT